jgi:phosphoesterase RecJ-like protein
MIQTKDYRLIYQKIQAANKIFLASHYNCPDANGSLCALIDVIESAGKKYYSYLDKPLNKQSGKFQSEVPNFKDFDLYLIVDAGDLKQTGLESELELIIRNRQRHLVINLDHHKTNEYFGHINLVDKTASSACEMVYQLFLSNNLKITTATANNLLAGIIADTGNFTNAATNQSAFQIAADLVWQGANIFQIIQGLYGTEESINTLRLWGRIFERIAYNHQYEIAFSYVLQKDFNECKVKEEAAEVVSNLLNYIRGIKAGVLLKEKSDGSLKVSLRSNYPGVDVSRLAKLLGGGGHQKAAGFTVARELVPGFIYE